MNCPVCDQPLPLTCAHCGAPRDTWKEPTRRSKYCSQTHQNTSAQRRKNAKRKALRGATK